MKSNNKKLEDFGETYQEDKEKKKEYIKPMWKNDKNNNCRY